MNPTRADAPPLLEELWPGAAFTSIERALLLYLISAASRIVPADELLREVWGYAEGVQTATVATTMRRLRAKVEPDPSEPTYLLTVRGRGYQLLLPKSQQQPATRAELAQRLDELLGDAQDWLALLDAGSPRTTNLPADPDPFVGREDDLSRMQTLFADGARLVTVHGTAGLGKTRLARRFAARQHEAHPGGVWFCDLSSAHTGAEALAVVADTLGVVRAGTDTRTPAEHLSAVLDRRGPTFLVLDNFEQLDEGAAAELERLLGLTPKTRVVVTSRSRLGIASERLVHIGPLSDEEARDLLRMRIEAIRLDRSSPLDDEHLRSIAVVLEGIPLAIEMAAARARVLPLAELAVRLGQSFRSLSLDRPGAPDRQKTMVQAIDWSWALLSEAERRLLTQLCVFQGGAPLEALEQVVEVDSDALVLLGRLLDKSMVRLADEAGRKRLTIYQGIREFVTAQADQPLTRARERHADWALSFASRWADAYDRDPAAGPALRQEQANLIGALRWLVSRRSNRAIDLAESLWAVFNGRDARAYRELLYATRAGLSPSGHDATRLHALVARTCVNTGEFKQAEVELERGLERADKTSALYGGLLITKMLVKHRRGESAEAIALGEHALALAERHDWRPLMPHALNAIGVAHEVNDPQKTASYMQRALVEAEALRMERWMTLPWGNLAGIYARRGEDARARECLVRASELVVRYGDPSIQQHYEGRRAETLAILGDYAEAADAYRTAAELAERNGNPGFRAPDLVNRGIVTLYLGDHETARVLLERARTSVNSTGAAGSPTALFALAFLVATHAMRDEVASAEACLAALERFPNPGTVDTYTHDVDLCTAHLDLARARLARAAGDHSAADAHRARAAQKLASIPAPTPSSLKGSVNMLASAIQTAEAQRAR